MYMKRITAVILAHLCLFCLFSCRQSSKIQYVTYEAEHYTSLTQAEILSSSADAKASGSLKVAFSQKPSGIFMDGIISEDTSFDKAVLDLITGYSTVAYTKEGKYIVDPVTVNAYRAVSNTDGTTTYTFMINDDLYYSDGTKITAADYVFTVLLLASSEWNYFQNAESNHYYEFLGYKSYHTGAINYYPGVRYLSENIFSLTISDDADNTFYSLSSVDVYPLPIGVIAPGVRVCDSSDGAYLDGDFSSVLLNKTVFSSDGYAYLPSVTSGPYVFEKYNQSQNSVELSVNENFLCRYDGARPQIEKLILQYSDDVSYKLLKRGYDLVLSLSGTALSEAKESDAFDFDTHEYLRRGFAQIMFSCDQQTTGSESVRKAIAYLIPYSTLTSDVVSSNGSRVYSFYSQSMWEYSKLSDRLGESLTLYDQSLKTAEELIVKDGWNYNYNGGHFQKGVDTVRYKKTADGTLVPLIIEWANSDCELTDFLYKKLLPIAYSIGIKINSTTLPLNTLLSYVSQKSSPYQMYSFGYGFTDSPAFWYYFPSLDDDIGLNFNHCYDAELCKIAEDMKNTAPGDCEKWLELFYEFQIRYNQILPSIPLYEDVYADLSTTKLKNYEPSAEFSFSDAVIRAFLD